METPFPRKYVGEGGAKRRTIFCVNSKSLSAYVLTKDLRRMMRLVRELKLGEIYVNRPGGDAGPGVSCRHPRQGDGRRGR
jgi:hypothetical protein